MRRLIVCVLVVSACASGSEMRPRGRRNSVRINDLDTRIARVEGNLEAVRSGTLQARVKELETELATLRQQLAAVQTHVFALEAARPAAQPPAP